ncbi:MAG: hypothetical protein JSV78_13180, partial [Phycisphaerales bacterium]
LHRRRRDGTRSCGKPFSHAFLRESSPDPARQQSDREFLHGPANSDGSAIQDCHFFRDSPDARRGAASVSTELRISAIMVILGGLLLVGRVAGQGEGPRIARFTSAGIKTKEF